MMLVQWRHQKMMIVLEGRKTYQLSKKINYVAVLIGVLRVIKSLSLLCNSLSKYH